MSALIPDVLGSLPAIMSRIGDRKPAVFLDYDGTLTPIVPHPADATTSEEARKVLTDLAHVVTLRTSMVGHELDSAVSLID